MDQTGNKKSQSPIKMSMHNLDKLMHSIKDSWKQQIEENEKVFDQFLTYCKMQQQVFTVKFICSLSGESLDEPVSLQQCVLDKKHLQDCFDLKSILKYLIQNESNFMQDGYIQCPLCRSKSHFKKDIPLIPNLFFHTLKERLNNKDKPITYQVATQTIIPIYSGIQGKEQVCYQNQIINVLNCPNNSQQNFSTLRKLTKPNEAFKFSYLCLMGNIRIQIPVRGALCRHIECYDYLYLQSNMALRENKTFKCLYFGCQETINVNELQLDIELYEIGLKSYNFSSDFIFDQQSQHLIDTYSITNYDPHIVAYRKLVPTTSETIAYIKSIFDLTDRIYSSTKNQDLTEKFYEHPLKGELNLIKNQPTNSKVEIPCRCIRCNKIDVCDLRYMSCILYQVQHPENRSGVKNYMVSCPLCNNPFSPKKYHRDQTVQEQVYVDTKMLSFLSQNKNYNLLTKDRYLQFLDGKLNPFLRFEELESPIVNLQSCQLKIRCLLSNQKIKTPVRGIYCQHPEAFDEQSILEMIQQGQLDLSIIQCPKCSQSIYKLTHDNFLKDLLLNYDGDSEDVEILPKTKVIKAIK